MIGRLNHIAIAVPDLAKASELYRTVMGAKVSAPKEQPAHGVTVVFVELPNTKIELLHPLGEKSPIANFLARNADGALQEAIEDALSEMLADLNTAERADDRRLEEGARQAVRRVARAHLGKKPLTDVHIVRI